MLIVKKNNDYAESAPTCR